VPEPPTKPPERTDIEKWLARWHLPVRNDRRCDDRGPHLRLDEVLYPPGILPGDHRLAWPTRALEVDDPVAAARPAPGGGEQFVCALCRHQRKGSRRWRTVLHAEQAAGVLAGTGCALCARPWPRSAFAAAGYYRNGGGGHQEGFRCVRCAARDTDGGWFQPTGLRRSPGGQCWHWLLTAHDPVIVWDGAVCIECGAALGEAARAAPSLPAPWRLPRRPRSPGGAWYPPVPAESGLLPAWPYLAHPIDLADAFARELARVAKPDWRGQCSCSRQPAHNNAWHAIVVRNEDRPYWHGPLWAHWYARSDAVARPAGWWTMTPDGPFACETCARGGVVPGATPFSMALLARTGISPPAGGIACQGCATPVIPERWHRASAGECAPRCQGPHLRVHEVLRPPGFLTGERRARLTRPLEHGDVVGRVLAQRRGEQFLCPWCARRARRSRSPARPLLHGELGPGLPERCDRCHKPWASSAWYEWPAHTGAPPQQIDLL
jgi:hypothetical protein